MNHYRTRLLIMPLCLFLLTSAVLGCASAAQPNAGADRSPLAQAEGTEDPTPMPERTPEPPPEQVQASEPKPTTEPTMEPVSPTKAPLPHNTPRPRKQRPTRPAPTPVPVHPDGLEGCKSLTLYGDDAGLAYHFWCMEELADHVKETCHTKPTTTEQRQCGEDIVQEYDSFGLRKGPPKCAGLGVRTNARAECYLDSSKDTGKVFDNLYEAFGKVRIGGDRDPDVVKALEDTITCLEDQGFKDINQDLLFGWQKTKRLQDRQAQEALLSEQDKDLRERLIEPSQSCAQQEGLFEAQDAAWAAELRRLQNAEPELVTDLIRGGYLEALEKPGVMTSLTRQQPPPVGDDAR